MAAGKISIQANDGKVAGVVFEDGASSNVTVSVPKEGGTLATQTGLSTKQDILVSGTNIKTINSNSILGSGDIVINDGINLETANSYDIGVGQTWQDLKASRAAGVTYTNTTGKPIAVSLIYTASATSSTAIQLFVDGVIVDEAFYTNNTSGECQSIVPNNSTYMVSHMPNMSWSELR